MRTWRPGPAVQLVCGLGFALAIALAAIGPQRLIAQIEGERGIAPVARTADIKIGGIEVNVTGNNAVEAQLAGWKLAQKKAWEALGGPAMPESQIDSMVSAVVVEQEQIGPRRYIARLGVIFDRMRAGQYLGGAGAGTAASHSAPMLVIPLLYSGGTAQVFEVRGEWQRVWATYDSGASPIDYVRPSGAGSDSLILNAGQTARRSRTWWRNILDQFGASDVLIPVARLERQWPGGAVRGTFTARYGPDNRFLETFTLTANDESGVEPMLRQALAKMDAIYGKALADGLLKPDPSLVADREALNGALAAIGAALDEKRKAAEAANAAANVVTTPQAQPTAAATVGTFVVQFASPDARAIDAALTGVRGLPGVQGASTSSIAIGGTSVMRVTFLGDLDTLAGALRARGWQVTVGNGALSIRK